MVDLLEEPFKIVPVSMPVNMKEESFSAGKVYYPRRKYNGRRAEKHPRKRAGRQNHERRYFRICQQ